MNTSLKRDVAWLKKYEELRQYHVCEGHCNVPKGFNENQSLAMWVTTQRTQYKFMRQGKPSSMTELRIQHLENIGFKWSIKDPNDDAWYKKYEELKRYKDRTGHCNVPQGCNENKSLGMWVNNQRKNINYMRQGKRSNMTEQRIRYLESIGFQWSVKDPNDDAWNKKYEELKEYKCREGHCNVSTLFNENKSLGMWVSSQRTQYKNMIQGKPSSITEQRIKHLENVGFQWSIKDPNDDAWYKKFRELKHYKNYEGHCDVPKGFSENQGLGMWVDAQRKQYKYMMQGKPSNMTELRKEHLENIGFKWSIKGRK